MRSFACAWPAYDPIAQQPVAEMPWGHIAVLLDKLEDSACVTGASEAVTHGWSRVVLEHHIRDGRHTWFGTASTNLERVLERRRRRR